jgi:hypothetical protein
MVLHAVRRLFEEQNRSIDDYITGTKWDGDFGALRWLDHRYQQAFGEPSILAELIESRRGIYRRLYTVRPAGGRSTDDLLFRYTSQIAGADGGTYAKELQLRTAIAARLVDAFGVTAGPHDVLVDVPRRGSLNDPGDAYIVSRGGPAQRLVMVSEPIKMLQENYKRLTQRVRFFISPQVASVITKERRERDRKAIRAIINDAVNEVRAHDNELS